MTSANDSSTTTRNNMMVKGIVYIATTLDGKIADLNGDVSFLDDYQSSGNEQDGDMGFNEFLSSIDIIIMGRKTFDKVLSFGQDAWPYGEIPLIVWTRSVDNNDIVPTHLQNSVKCSNLSPKELFQQLQQGKDGRTIITTKRAYIDGGFTVQSFLKDGLVDELIITQVPLILGDGIALFSNDNQPTLKLKQIQTKVYSNGLVQSKYQVIE